MAALFNPQAVGKQLKYFDEKHVMICEKYEQAKADSMEDIITFDQQLNSGKTANLRIPRYTES